MKVALVHDYLKEYGGAERVLEALYDIFPDAPIYTSVYLPAFLGPHKERFKNYRVKTSWAQFIPFKAKLISPLRLLSPLLFRSFDFSEFDVVITSATGAYFPNTLQKGKAKLICYCHTPPRYLYGYATARQWKSHFLLRIIGETLNHFLRMVDFNVSKNVDQYIANSEEVKSRIQKFYRKDAVVIYPPVLFPIQKDSRQRDYFLTGGRLAAAKHVDVIVKACTELGVPLKVFGKAFAGYGEALQKDAGKTVEFLGEVSDEEKYELMRGAKAFLFASEDEDFGITPVEAMGQGTPVIAYRSGGVKETVIENKTGLFFDQLKYKSLMEKLKEFDSKKIKSDDCRHQALKFSLKNFEKNINAIVAGKNN